MFQNLSILESKSRALVLPDRVGIHHERNYFREVEVYHTIVASIETEVPVASIETLPRTQRKAFRTLCWHGGKTTNKTSPRNWAWWPSTIASSTRDERAGRQRFTKDALVGSICRLGTKYFVWLNIFFCLHKRPNNCTVQLNSVQLVCLPNLCAKF